MKKIAVAPMMDWTDRHCRYFLRLLSPSAELYTEMLAAVAVHHGDAERLLRFHAAEHPVAVQLGGSDPGLMAAAAARAAAEGYDAVNINVGCPSNRVQSARFGACLMASPALVAECYRAMVDAAGIPVSVKCRTGIDDRDSDAFLFDFVETLMNAGCRQFIVHARIALLSGLSPKENRHIPPLNYERVFRLKRVFPELTLVINGGLRSLQDVARCLARADGVMIGREAYRRPYFLAELAAHLDSGFAPPSRREIVMRMLPYIRRELDDGVRLNSITRHLLGLFAGQPGARAWRRYLSQNAHRQNDSGVLSAALDSMASAADEPRANAERGNMTLQEH